MFRVSHGVSKVVLGLGLALSQSSLGLIYQSSESPICDAVLAWAKGRDAFAGQSGGVVNLGASDFDYQTRCITNLTLSNRRLHSNGTSTGTVEILVVSGGACVGPDCRYIDETFRGSYRRYPQPDGANFEFWLGPRGAQRLSKATLVDKDFDGKKVIFTHIPVSGRVMFVEGDGGIPESGAAESD